MMSLGAYYAYIVTNEMRQAEKAPRWATAAPRRSLTDRMRAAFASLLARRPAHLSARGA